MKISYLAIKQIFPPFILLAILAFGSCDPEEDAEDPVPAPATIIGIAPASGPVGTEVIVAGTNFSLMAAENEVRFNNVVAVVRTASASALVVTAPAGGATGIVSVKVNNQTAVNGPVFTYVTPAPTPTITNVNPNSGKTGDIITITGTNFSTILTENEVHFTGTNNTNIIVPAKTATATQLTVEVPSAALTGSISVRVKSQFFRGPDFTITAAPASGDIKFFRPPNTPVINLMVVDKNSNVYAKHTDGTFVKYAPSGTVLKTFAKAEFNSQYQGFGALGTDVQGNVWVLNNRFIGSNAYYQLFKITDNGAVEKVGAEFKPSNTLEPVAKPFVVNSRNEVFYVSDYGNVHKLDAAQVPSTYLSIGNGSTDVKYVSIALDAAENLHFLTTQAKSATVNEQTIVKYDASKVKTTLLTFTTNNLGNTNASVPIGTLGQFRNFAIGKNNDYYVADYDGNRVRRLFGTNQTEVIAGSGEFGRNDFFLGLILEGPKLQTPLPKPTVFFFDPKLNRFYTGPDNYQNNGFTQMFTL
ncbi:IPT/TIG domain-containing protein [Rufibacter sp. LB8]|uniref:IPT/TIG domain-containing protein n=1 Tax=Rufibacter sp. LB8 TaxID=2777781 RepID=UPI00178C7AEF|nr:IPT/TIG domain-containing protein [Rufibacter sp. LB8]